MTITQVVLSDPARSLSSLVKPRDGCAFQGLAVTATVREVKEDRVGSDGTVDSSQFLSDAAVSLNLSLYSGTRALLDDFGQYAHPGFRPVLTVTDDEWAGPRQLGLRYAGSSAPVELGKGRVRDVQYQWQAPNGVWEASASVTLNVPVTIPSTTGLVIKAADGLHVKAADGLHIPPTSAAGEFQVTNPGTLASQWTGQLYGPATGPKLANDTTGLEIVFTDSLVLGAGQFIALDSAARSANLNGDPGSPVLSNLDFDATDWWTMPGGVSQLRYFPTAASGGGVAVIVFKPAWPA